MGSLFQIPVKVFCDIIGHPDLAYSVLALFNRVGCDVAFPSEDPEWLEQLYTVSVSSEDLSGASFISLEQFRDTEFDVYVSTCHLTEKWVAQEAKGKGVFIRQINNLLEQPCVAQNVIMGVRHDVGKMVNRFDYIPEHPTRYQPNPESPKPYASLAFNSYIKGHPDGSHVWSAVCEEMGYCLSSGNVPGEVLHELFWQSRSYSHIKATGCCGFTLREAMFCGLPVLVDTSWSQIYQTPAQEYLVDQENCIDLAVNGRTHKQSIQLLNQWVHCPEIEKRNKQALQTTRRLINFQKEANAFKDWLKTI